LKKGKRDIRISTRRSSKRGALELGGRGRVHIIPCPLHPCKIKTNPIKTRTKI